LSCAIWPTAARAIRTLQIGAMNETMGGDVGETGIKEIKT
jgi:hypothetical protein